MRHLIFGALVAGALIAIFAGVWVGSRIGDAQVLPSKSALLTESEMVELGLRLSPIPASAKSPRVGVADAVRIAAERYGRVEAPAEVLHVMVPADDSSPVRSAYVVVYIGGPLIPGGPEGLLRATRLSGVVIDDQTGEFLTGFYYGGPVN